MTDSRDNPTPRPLEEVIFQFLEACEECQDEPSYILEEMCRAHPEVAARLRTAVGHLSDSGFVTGEADVGAGHHERMVGRYRLLERLGTGGMGVVYLARSVDGENVAVKLLHPRERHEPSAKARFTREARAVRALDHPSIVRVLDHGEWEEDGVLTPFLAMEFHAGVTLDRFLGEVDPGAVEAGDDEAFGALLHRAAAPTVDSLGRASTLRGPWWRVVCRMGVSLASALAHAHGRGVIHRDIKPSNVLLTEDGRPLLLDFGLASLTGSGRLTASGAWLGSLPYLAPERLTADQVKPSRRAGATTEPDGRSDVYALGLLLHELLSFAPAFAPQGKEQLAVAVMRGVRLAAAAEFPWLASAPCASLDAILARATERLPRHRYGSARELAWDLNALLHGRAPKARPLPPTTRAMRTIKQHPWRAATAGLLLALAIGAPLLTTHLNAGFDRDLLLEEERRDFESVQAKLASLRSGLLALSRTSIGSHPRFAASAIQGLVAARAELESAKERLGQKQDEPSRQLCHKIDTLLADVLINIADARQTLGFYPAAVEAYGAHRRHMEEMLERSGPDLHLSTELGRSWGQLARSLMAADAQESALAEAQKSVAMFEDADRAKYQPEVTKDQLCAARLLLAGGLRRSGRTQEALALLDQAQSEFLEWTGPDPLYLRPRARLAEIEAIRARWNPVPHSSKERLAAFDRAAAWIDDSREPFENSVTTALIRMDIEVNAILALDKLGRVDEALERAENLVRLAAKLCAARGDEGGDDEPLQGALARAEEMAALARLRTGKHGAGIAHLRRVYEESRTAYLERRDDTDRLIEFTRTAGNYANQLVLVKSLGKGRLGEAVRATTDALDFLEASGLQHVSLVKTKRLCHYARGIAEGQRGRRDPAARDADAVLELSAKGDAVALRLAADVWSELVAFSPEAPMAEEARQRTLEFLEMAVEAGYGDQEELEATEALDPLRADPRFQKILSGLR